MGVRLDMDQITQPCSKRTRGAGVCAPFSQEEEVSARLTDEEQAGAG